MVVPQKLIGMQGQGSYLFILSYVLEENAIITLLTCTTHAILLHAFIFVFLVIISQTHKKTHELHTINRERIAELNFHGFHSFSEYHESFPMNT